MDDTRFVHSPGGTDSIVTSSAREDGGLFELNLRDERYLPFEGAGAISDWRLELPSEFRQFDYGTVSDVILHLRIVALDAGEPLKQAALGQLRDALMQMEVQQGKAGLFRLFSLRHDFPNAWQRLIAGPLEAGTPTTELALTSLHFPMATQGRELRIDQLTLFVRLRKDVAYYAGDPLEITMRMPGSNQNRVGSFNTSDTVLGGLPFSMFALGAPGIAVESPGAWKLTATKIPQAIAKAVQVNGADVVRLDADKISEIGLLAHYRF